MDFAGFLGNEGLKQRLNHAVEHGKLSHCYLITGPEGSGKKTLAKLLAAAMQCTSSQNRPCRACPQCRKVLADAHPDVVVVDDDKKNVSVDTARWAKTDLYIRPNEGNRKIYLFPRGGSLRIEAQNALLKVMEEPPAYGVFLLLAERAESLLPTIRSRCVELALTPVPWAEAESFLRQADPESSTETLQAAWRRAGGFLGQAMKYLKNSGSAADERAEGIAEAFADGDRFALSRILCKMEKLNREQLIPILRRTQALTAEALSTKSGTPAVTPAAQRLASKRTAAVLMQAYKDLAEALRAADGNVGVGHICGFLAVHLR